MIGADDVLILLALLPGGEARFWSSRAVIDPRVTPTEIARRTGLSRSTVQSRLGSWREQGFLTGSEVWPNPKLFGANLATIDTTLGPGVAVDGILDSLSKVEGVLSARDYLDEDGRRLRIFLVDDGPSGLERHTRLIQHISGSVNRLRAEPYWIPEPSCMLTPLDWRIVACYRAYPDDTLIQNSSRLGIGPRTLARRRDRLLDSHALWWLLSTDNSKQPIADFHVSLRDPSRRAEVKSFLDGEMGGWVPCSADGFGVPPPGSSSLIVGLTFVDSPAMLDSLARRLAGLPAVSSVRWRIPCGFRSFSEWFDRRIGARLQNSWLSSNPATQPHGLQDGSLIVKTPSSLPVSFGSPSELPFLILPSSRGDARPSGDDEGPTPVPGRRR